MGRAVLPAQQQTVHPCRPHPALPRDDVHPPEQAVAPWWHLFRLLVLFPRPVRFPVGRARVVHQSELLGGASRRISRRRRHRVPQRLSRRQQRQGRQQRPAEWRRRGQWAVLRLHAARFQRAEITRRPVCAEKIRRFGLCAVPGRGPHGRRGRLPGRRDGALFCLVGPE